MIVQKNHELPSDSSKLISGFPFDGHRTPNEEKIAEQSFLKEVLMNIYEVRLKIATKLVDEIFDRQFYIEGMNT